MYSPGLNRPSQVSHGPVCHYLLQVPPNPGLTFVTAESDQYLWISTLSFLPGYRRSTRNITVSFYWDDGPLLGYSLALPLALWLLCSCGAFRDSFLHLHHLQSSLCSLRFLSPEGILCLSLPSQHGSLYQRPRPDPTLSYLKVPPLKCHGPTRSHAGQVQCIRLGHRDVHVQHSKGMAVLLCRGHLPGARPELFFMVTLGFGGLGSDACCLVIPPEPALPDKTAGLRRGTANFITFRNDSPCHCCGAGMKQNRCERKALTKQICGLC